MGIPFDMDYISGLWDRALETLDDAMAVRYPHSIANRSYYAAFYAVTALFGIGGIYFNKHTQLEAAVHRDLVHTGKWPAILGKKYSDLLKYRTTGDYKFNEMVTQEEAKQAIEFARDIIDAVHNENPIAFPF